MKLTVSLGDLLGHRVWNAMAEPLLVPIGVSGGGFGQLRISVRATITQQIPCMDHLQAHTWS